ncbi:hypothetical protein HYDPIDRAFT_107551 [Hydnomerulius pinastri MD-312]|nr:hypothetical protein HYDPIDRAFT_107551 [Hydnomerulius pinastri MD-312]
MTQRKIVRSPAPVSESSPLPTDPDPEPVSLPSPTPVATLSTSRPAPLPLRQPTTTSIATWRRILLDTFDRYIFNKLPTHLLCINTMQLVNRETMRETFLPQIEQITESEFKESVSSWENPDRAFLVEGEVGAMISSRIQYAILSHRWGRKEPSFGDMASGANITTSLTGWVRKKKMTIVDGPGFQKLLRFCEKASIDYGCTYVWSDTCCIDKSSSAELEEAIRSMFRWYRNAEVCIAYLAESSTMEDFETEPWFTRGWTLQELLAPSRMRFYNKDWEPFCPHWLIGSNDKQNTEMQNAISRVTKIPSKDIKYFQPGCRRVYDKMVWASKRRTTRIEDIAYALIGIFDISMPIAYGEGTWAFYRLMEVIAQRSADRGFFAWAGSPSLYSLALPGSPACYGNSARLWDLRDDLAWDMPFSLTKEGLQVELLVVNVEMLSPVHPGPEVGDTLSTTLGTRHWLEMMPISFSPKWSSRSGTPGEIISTFTPPRELYICHTWAVGLVYGYDKSLDDDGRPVATLGGGKDYFCLLLGQLMNNSKWVKLKTPEALTFRCEESVREPLISLCLQHGYLNY